MISEIVTVGMLSLPNALAIVGATLIYCFPECKVSNPQVTLTDVFW
jgi:hypothetical protein